MRDHDLEASDEQGDEGDDSDPVGHSNDRGVARSFDFLERGKGSHGGRIAYG